MGSLSARQLALLSAVVKDYIQTAEPVSSEGLLARHHYKFSPATIRNDLLALEKQGLLKHVHTSSGRVPTDEGYRVFINDLLQPSLTKRDEQAIRTALEEAEDRLAALCETLAERTRTYVQALSEQGELESSGFSLVFQEPEFADQSAILEFASVADELRAEPAIIEDLASEPRVLIGRELKQTFRQGEALALVAMSTKQAGRRTAWLVLGPKRMLYPKVMGILDFLKKSSPFLPSCVILTIFS